MKNLLEKLNFKDGLIPTIIADCETNLPLTLCYLNEEALIKSVESGTVHLYRRSKGKLMQKGETSGHTQEIKEIRVDCAGNSLLFLVKQNVAACHKGFFTCYFERYNPSDDKIEIEGEQLFDPEEVY